MQTKCKFRNFLKSKLKKQYCIYDKLCARKILALILHYKKPKAYKIHKNNKLFYSNNKASSCNILLYNSLPSEVNVDSIIKKLRQSKKYNVFIPKVQKNGLKMVKYRLPLIKNKFNIKETSGYSCNNHTLILDIAIVPVLGVDKKFRRIGFGKGMYDRFYADLKIKPYSIFVSRKHYVSQYDLCEWYDIQADIYVSSYQ